MREPGSDGFGDVGAKLILCTDGPSQFAACDVVVTKGSSLYLLVTTFDK